MEFHWDHNKSESNRDKLGLDFAAIHEFDWATAVVHRSDRFQEERYTAIGYIGPGLRLWVVVFTPRGDTFRIISIRPASRQERDEYAKS